MIKLTPPYRVRCIDNQGSGNKLVLEKEYIVLSEEKDGMTPHFMIQGEKHPWTIGGGFAQGRFEILP